MDNVNFFFSEQEAKIMTNDSNNMNKPTPDSNRGSSDVINEGADALLVRLDVGFNNDGTRA